MDKLSFATIAEQPVMAGRMPITWELKPPSTVDAERVILNRTALEQAGRIAGFDSITVAPDTTVQADNARADMHVSGIYADGSATGAVIGRKPSPTPPAITLDGVEPKKIRGVRQFWHPAVRIGVERAPLGSAVANRTQKGVPIEQAWAKEVDSHLRRGLAMAAFEALAKPDWASLAVALPLTMEYATTPTHTLFLSAVMQGMSIPRLRHRPIVDVRGFKPGLFPFGFQPERFIAAALYIATRPMVTVQE